MIKANKSKPVLYRSYLSAESAVKGIQASKKNALRLFEDSRTLFGKKRYATACALSILAIEEATKPAIIRKIVLANSSAELKRGWQLFACHIDKINPWIIPHLIKETKTHVDFIEQFMRKKNPILLDSIKQLSFYVGCHGKAHWSDPAIIVNESLANSVINNAAILIMSGQLTNIDTLKGIELWKEHMQGLFSTGYARANEMIIEYFKKAKTLKIFSDENDIPKETAFDFMTTALVLGDGEAREQKDIFK